MIKTIKMVAFVLVFSITSKTWAAGPNIQVWYNYDAPASSPNIAFGLPGNPQQWLNILGNVQSDAGIASLTYSINGGPERTLNVGPNKRRLVNAGDFNVDVDPTDPADPFFPGANLIDLKAKDNNGAVTTKTVTVDYATGYVWPYPYTANWQSTTIQNIESIAHIVDGKWQITPNGIHITQPGYDRTIALGDKNWSTNHMSVTVPFTLHSDFSGIGFGMGWQGHTGFARPRKGWPGTYAWLRGPLSNPKLNILLYDPVEWEVVVAEKSVPITLNTTYMLKAYSEPVDNTTSNFCIKLWPQSGTEPADWTLCSHVPYRDGSVLLVAYNTDATFGNVNIGPLAPVQPSIDTTPPIISNVQASSVTSTSAVITWTTNEASDSRVDYGPNISYGATLTDPALVTSHSINLTGLAPGTEYQYRVQSKDTDNNLAVTPNQAFATASAIAPNCSTPTPSGLCSDNFNAPALNTSLWTVTNPKSDSTVSADGARIRLSVPAGSEHNLWSDVYDVVNIVQPISKDTDFKIKTKFDSTVTQRYQMQGLLVAGPGGNNYIRCEFHHDGTSQQIYAATIINGKATRRLSAPIALNAPMHMQLTRAGNVWTVQYSGDGITWLSAGTFNQEFNATRAGLYAGNSGSLPQHTALADYFIVDDTLPPSVGSPADTTPPIISSVQASSVTKTSAVITWTTNEASDSRVDYGQSISYGKVQTNPARVTSHRVNITGLTPGTTYRFRVQSKDASNNLSASPNQAFATAKTIGPPCINPSPSGLCSDNFNTPYLNNALWTGVNPKGDGTISTDGAHALLSVPAKSSHNLWKSDDVVRIYQPITANTDFELETQFDSSVTDGYQMQGLIVKGTTGYIRSEFHFDGTSVRAFAATVINGIPIKRLSKVITLNTPMYMRLTRVDDQWTLSYSANGTNWAIAGTFTQPLVPTQAGVYAGNAGSLPQHTASVNYFAAR